MCTAVCKPKPRKMRFNLSGTFKFPTAQAIVRESQKPHLILREKLAYGTYYAVGVFFLLKTGEEQIGWVPERLWKM